MPAITMGHSLGLLFISGLISGITAIAVPEDDIFICRKNVFEFGEPHGSMIRTSSFVLSPDEKLSKIKIPWPLVKMYMEVSGATFMICDSSSPIVDIVGYDDRDTGHFRVTRQGGSLAFGTISVGFKPSPIIPTSTDDRTNADYND